jgi:prepilin-type N-terminal cleavage/methylation domain-containing protein
MIKDNKQNNKGFTLVEMIVSVALFSIVIIVAIGGILTIIDANRKSQTLTLVMNNLNFALEVMTRNIKTADPRSLVKSTKSFTVGGDTVDGIPYFSLTNQDDDKITYFYYSDDDISGSIYRIVGEGPIAYPIIPEEVVIEDFDFDVTNDDQPRIVLKIEGYAEVTERTRSDFTVQTTVSPRRLNIGSI